MLPRLRKAALVCVAVVVGFGMVACGGDAEESGSSDSTVLVIDPSVTQENPVVVELDGLTGEFFFGTAAGYRSGVEIGKRPVAYWRLEVNEGETPKNFRATVQLIRDGEPVDSYYRLPGFDGYAMKNELVLNDIEIRSLSGLDPQMGELGSDYKSDSFVSPTGTEFEFRLSEISVSDDPFTPSELSGIGRSSTTKPQPSTTASPAVEVDASPPSAEEMTEIGDKLTTLIAPCTEVTTMLTTACVTAAFNSVEELETLQSRLTSDYPNTRVAVTELISDLEYWSDNCVTSKANSQERRDCVPRMIVRGDVANVLAGYGEDTNFGK